MSCHADNSPNGDAMLSSAMSYTENRRRPAYLVVGGICGDQVAIVAYFLAARK